MQKFDLHIHSCYSQNLLGTKLFSPPSTSTPKDIIETALSKGITVIAVTDHDNIQGSLRTIELAQTAYKGEILVVPGVEVSTKDGHILAYNVYENIPKNLSAQETVRIIKKKGGVAVAAHPFNPKFSISRKLAEEMLGDFFAYEVANSHALKNKQAAAFVQDNKLCYTAGSDAHHLSEIGLCYGITTRKARSVKDFLALIKKRDIQKVHTDNSWLLLRVIPTAIKAFSYWKVQQSLSFLQSDVFLPYEDQEIVKIKKEKLPF